MGSFSPEGFRKPFLFEVGVPQTFLGAKRVPQSQKSLRNTDLWYIELRKVKKSKKFSFVNTV
jgi:hypothetical protein